MPAFAVQRVVRAALETQGQFLGQDAELDRNVWEVVYPGIFTKPSSRAEQSDKTDGGR